MPSIECDLSSGQDVLFSALIAGGRCCGVQQLSRAAVCRCARVVAGRGAAVGCVKQTVAVYRFELHTEVVDFERNQQIGRADKVQHTVVNRGTESRMDCAVRVFIDYAFFCGTSREVTQGLGRRIFCEVGQATQLLKYTKNSMRNACNVATHRFSNVVGTVKTFQWSVKQDRYRLL